MTVAPTPRRTRDGRYAFGIARVPNAQPTVKYPLQMRANTRKTFPFRSVKIRLNLLRPLELEQKHQTESFPF